MVLVSWEDEIYPIEPRPVTVEISCAVETYPAVPSPATVEVKTGERKEGNPFTVLTNCELDTYPAVPRPVTVEANCEAKNVVETKFATVDANSAGSMKLLMYVRRPCVVDPSCDEETYPAVPKPATVEAKLLPMGNAVRIPAVVDVNWLLEMYPAVPRPVTVEANCEAKNVVETKFATVEANSVGSMKLLIYVRRPCVVEPSCDEEIYPAVPRPTTVEVS